LKAVVLAAGKGERLLPLTESRPKPMIPIGGSPLLEWILKGLREASIEKVLIVTHYLEEHINNHFEDGSNWGLDIEYVKQKEMKGTANAFGLAESFVEEDDFLGVYGDLYIAPESFKGILKAEKKCEVIIATVQVEDPSGLGIIDLNGDRVSGIVEKPAHGDEPSKLANAGIYVFNSDIFQWIKETGLSERGEYEITDTLKLLINSGLKVKAFTIQKDGWLDVGNPWNLLDANYKALGVMKPCVEGEVENGARINGPVKICKGAKIRSGTYIEGPVYIGPNCDIGPNCYIRSSSSIGSSVRIGNACEVKNSIVMDDTRIAHLSYVGDSIIGRGCNLGAGTITANIRFDKKNVKVNIKNRLIDTGRIKMGAIIGDGVQTGVNVNILPGVRVGSGAWIVPGLTVYKDVKTGVFMKE